MVTTVTNESPAQNRTRKLTREQFEKVLRTAMMYAEESRARMAANNQQSADVITKEMVRAGVQTAINRLKLQPSVLELRELEDAGVSRTEGLGFLDPFLKRKDIEEVALNPDGRVYVLVKGNRFMTYQPEIRPSREEVNWVIQQILRPMDHAGTLSPTTPDIDAKLLGYGRRGRFKLIDPTITSTVKQMDYPSLNLRLFELEPVTPEKAIFEWKFAPEAIIRGLLEMVASGLRIMVVGGVKSGKTSMLSVLSHGIPLDARVVTAEEPQELDLPHLNIVHLEVHDAPIGSKFKETTSYPLRKAVDAALRMAMDWLIVGEVRDGFAAAALLRAQMSDHPGLTTLHAYSPVGAAERLALLLESDVHYPTSASHKMFAEAVDVVVQVGWYGQRRITMGVWEVGGVRGGQVYFRKLYRCDEPPVLLKTTRSRG